MRPVHLSIEGLTCFKEKQAVDFSGLELFAISGPTGAGKSTLLDAILFALYGTVPRMGKHNLRELISAARDRASVRFDFAVGDERFRVTRTLKRKGAATVRLERHDGTDFNDNIADQVKPCREAITALLGLDDTAFTQAVMLPQGEFARFLEADPAKRRDMLRALLRLDVFERMRQEAQRTSTASKLELDSAKRLLDSEYEGVDDQALAQLEEEGQRVGRELSTQRAERDAAHARLARLRTLREKTEELQRTHDKRDKLNGAEAEIEAAGTELDAARRAGPLRPLMEEATRAADQATAAAKEADEARAEHLAASDAHDEQAKALLHAEAAAKEIPELRDKVGRLDQILGRLPERDHLTEALTRQRDELSTGKEKSERLRIDLDKLSRKQQDQRPAVEEAHAELKGIQYDIDLDAALEEVRDLASKLPVLREALTRMEAEEKARREAVPALTERIEHLTREARKAQHDETEAREAFDRAELALHDAHRMDQANHVRESLVGGQPCPVCKQVVTDPPPADLRPEVQAAKTARGHAEEKLEDARKRVRAKHEALTREQGKADAASRAIAEAVEARRRAQEDTDRQEAAVRDGLQGRGQGSHQAIEAWVDEQIQASSDARVAHDEAKRKLEAAERHLVEYEGLEKTTRERLNETDEALRKSALELTDSENRFEAIRKEIAQVTGSEAPETERDAILKKIDELTSSQNRAATAAAETGNRLGAAAQALELKTETATRGDEDVRRRRQSRDKGIAEAGFEDATAVESAIRHEELQTGLYDRIQAHEREAHSVDQRIKTLETELGAERVSQDELESADNLAGQLTDAVEKLAGQTDKLRQQVSSMSRRLEHAGGLRKELENRASEHRLYNHLAIDLRSDRFQAYVLEEAFTELVEGASTRLLTLTGERYSLEFKDEEIMVVDHDNAGETRISDTLSGGETFLTSLALALALSDQVQRAAGAVHLDSLFIDEGFGTLDPETLAVVSETIQTLQVGGRMVGIITHIPELRDEFSQQVLVTKHQGFSTVEVRA